MDSAYMAISLPLLGKYQASFVNTTLSIQSTVLRYDWYWKSGKQLSQNAYFKSFIHRLSVSNFNFPRSKSRSSSSKISSLYEIEYVSGDQLLETIIPLVNLYEYFAKKKTSAFSVMGIRKFIKLSSNRKVMEYVKSSKFSSCKVPTTEEEQFISLNIPENV